MTVEPEDRDTATGAGTVLVRVFAHGTAWPRLLPPAPPAATVSVTVSDARLLDVPAETLEESGYRIAGVVAVLQPPEAGDVVDVLAPGTLRRAHPEWFRTLLDNATRVFDLQFGPVRQLLAPALRLHARHP